MSIAKRIRDARKRRGLLQREVAEALGVSQPTVALWERDDGWSPRPHRIKALAKLLGVKPHQLLPEDAR